MKDDPTGRIREQLRALERAVVQLPVDSRDRRQAAAWIRSMIGDQLAALTYWRPTCATCGAYLGDPSCNHGPCPG